MYNKSHFSTISYISYRRATQHCVIGSDTQNHHPGHSRGGRKCPECAETSLTSKYWYSFIIYIIYITDRKMWLINDFVHVFLKNGYIYEWGLNQNLLRWTFKFCYKTIYLLDYWTDFEKIKNKIYQKWMFWNNVFCRIFWNSFQREIYWNTLQKLKVHLSMFYINLIHIFLKYILGLWLKIYTDRHHANGTSTGV